MGTSPIAVIGAGSWGTALAIQFARVGRPTRLWGRDAALLATMHSARCNTRYLPDATFPPALEIETELQQALAGCLDVLVAAPSHAFRSLLLQLKPLLPAEARLAWATKGFELASGQLPHGEF